MKPWNDYATNLRNSFGSRVQKISIDAGFTCPNRDGSLSFDGCIYCVNKSFNPFYCSPSKSISNQIKEGINFFGKKYKTQKYLAYFQAYSNTYAPIEQCIELYNEALTTDGIVGLIIATRPDCVNELILKEIKKISKNKYLVIEYGVESTNNRTLELINRCHTYEQAIEAINLTNEYNIFAGAHLILGLPNESKNDMLNHAQKLSKLPLHTLKLHQLQILKNTKAEKMYYANPEQFTLFDFDDYVKFIADFLCQLNPLIMPERFSSESPRNMLIAPNWGGLKNFELLHKLEKYMIENALFQGLNFSNL